MTFIFIFRTAYAEHIIVINIYVFLQSRSFDAQEELVFRYKCFKFPTICV